LQSPDGPGDVSILEQSPGQVECRFSQKAQKFQVTATPTVRGRAMMLLAPLPKYF
jgi:hypothetical protein